MLKEIIKVNDLVMKNEQFMVVGIYIVEEREKRSGLLGYFLNFGWNFS